MKIPIIITIVVGLGLLIYSIFAGQNNYQNYTFQNHTSSQNYTFQNYTEQNQNYTFQNYASLNLGIRQLYPEAVEIQIPNEMKVGFGIGENMECKTYSINSAPKEVKENIKGWYKNNSWSLENEYEFSPKKLYYQGLKNF